MIKLFRTSSMWRPLSIMVDSKNAVNTYELDNIIFFNDKGIITQIGSGFFDDDKEREFEGNCVRKLKVDFNMKDNFIVKAEKDYTREVRYDLYIYEKNVTIKFLGKEQRYFGDIYSHWKVNDYDFWKYERTLKDKLCKLNKEAEEIIKLIADKYSYMGKGIDKDILDERIKALKKVNTQILQEVESINNYKIDE